MSVVFEFAIAFFSSVFLVEDLCFLQFDAFYTLVGIFIRICTIMIPLELNRSRVWAIYQLHRLCRSSLSHHSCAYYLVEHIMNDCTVVVAITRLFMVSTCTLAQIIAWTLLVFPKLVPVAVNSKICLPSLLLSSFLSRLYLPLFLQTTSHFWCLSFCVYMYVCFCLC